MKPQRNPLNPKGAPQQHEEAESIRQARETLNFLEPLCADPNFATFMNKAVAPALKKAEMDALDVNKTPEERSNAAFRHDSLRTVFRWPQEAIDSARKLIKAGEDQQARRPSQTPSPL